MSEATAERLRQAALARVDAGELDQALVEFDRALAVAADDEMRELVTINKADVMIALDRSGPEVQALPMIIMRRRNLRHVYLAAYALAFKYRTSNEVKRATFYGQLALDTSEEAGDPLWRALALNELASIYDMDSQFELAIECGQSAAQLLEQLGPVQSFRYGIALENLGASKVLNDEFAEGAAIIERALPLIVAPIHRAEAYIDLCFAYLGLGEFGRAREYGELGLTLASEPRQIRNAHYLLGEAAYNCGDLEAAEEHFDELTKFYPQFQNLKALLFAIDLRAMVNLKL